MAPSVIINIIMVPQIFPPKFPDKKLRAESQQLQHTDTVKAEAMFIDRLNIYKSLPRKHRFCPYYIRNLPVHNMIAVTVMVGGGFWRRGRGGAAGRRGRGRGGGHLTNQRWVLWPSTNQRRVLWSRDQWQLTVLGGREEKPESGAVARLRLSRWSGELLLDPILTEKNISIISCWRVG